MTRKNFAEAATDQILEIWCTDKTAQDKTSQDKTSQDKASQDKTSQDKTSQDKTSYDKTSHGQNVPRQNVPRDKPSQGQNVTGTLCLGTLCPWDVLSLHLQDTEYEDHWALGSRALDPHSFFSDHNPAVFLNADPNPGGKRIRIHCLA